MHTTNDDHMMWFLRYQAQQTEFFVILGYFLPFYPPDKLENQNLEKMKKTPGGVIIILNMSTINENHMMYDSWDMDRQNFFSFWTISCPFKFPPPPNNPENQNFEKMKKTPEDIIILHKCTINDYHMIYGSWDMKCTRRNVFSYSNKFKLINFGSATWRNVRYISCISLPNWFNLFRQNKFSLPSFISRFWDKK